jgi:hypothetical protein
MPTIRLFLSILAVVSLSACSITQLKGKVAGVEVEAKDANSKSQSGNFCPPGQAKKGNC